MSILIIEDEKRLVSILKQGLKGERYSIDVAYDGEEGLKKAMNNSYSLIILDILLPKKDGFSVCRELRQHNINTPVIILTARGSLEDRIVGFDVGADDYIVKPFGLTELFARMRAVLRRPQIIISDTIKIADLVMDRKKHEVTRAGVMVPLTPKEYMLLNVLMTNHGEAVNRKKLLTTAWGPEFRETNNELNVQIRYLRKKIDGKNNKPLIKTIRGVGFTLKE